MSTRGLQIAVISEKEKHHESKFLLFENYETTLRVDKCQNSGSMCSQGFVYMTVTLVFKGIELNKVSEYY